MSITESIDQAAKPPQAPEAAQRPPLRARDKARSLGISEAELVAASADNVRLRAAWRELLPQLPTLGRVMCLTRNEYAVHERHGRFEEVSVSGPHGLVLGPDIDLRIFLGNWKSGFAVADHVPSGFRRSLQFFDGQGVAAHKIYATDATDMKAFDALIEAFRMPADEAKAPLQITPAAPRKTDRPDAEINVPALREAWLAMRDTHDFMGLLRKQEVGRVQALRLVGDDLAHEVDAGSLRRVLGAAQSSELPIMCFVGSPGCIQIHTGPVKRLAPHGPWFNVLDPEFNLHLREDGIANAFIVRKPTDDGTVTSLELFDSSGDTIALFFGARKPGKPELELWRDIAKAQ